MTLNQFQQAANLSAGLAARWYPHISATINEFNITTIPAMAMFIAQVGHESAGFTLLQESFNYTVTGLRNTFPKRITEEQAAMLGRTANQVAKQEDIANLVYAGCGGNTASSDGWKYRGRGLIQITLLNNYRDCGSALNLDLLAFPDLLLPDENAARSAGWFWQAKGCNEIADSLKQVTLKINGGYNGLEDRQKRYEAARQGLT
jgi:putative chitinase